MRLEDRAGSLSQERIQIHCNVFGHDAENTRCQLNHLIETIYLVFIFLYRNRKTCSPARQNKPTYQAEPEQSPPQHQQTDPLPSSPNRPSQQVKNLPYSYYSKTNCNPATQHTPTTVPLIHKMMGVLHSSLWLPLRNCVLQEQ